MKTNTKILHLAPVDGRKSFGGKAVVIIADDNIALKSYDTIVCSYNPRDGFRRHWSGWSATTSRHVNSFLAFCGLDGGGKSWWDAQPVVDYDAREATA